MSPAGNPRPLMADDARGRDLHDHYASNARACGHADHCRKVTDERNWPTITGRSPCTCGHGTGTVMSDLPDQVRMAVERVTADLNSWLTPGYGLTASFDLTPVTEAPDPPAHRGRYNPLALEPDYEPELRQDPTGVDCFERYESPADGA